MGRGQLLGIVGLALIVTACEKSAPPATNGQLASQAGQAERLAPQVAEASGPAASTDNSLAPAAPTPPSSETQLSDTLLSDSQAAATQHPIDAIAQGQRYRQATSALDRGDFETAQSIRLGLAGDPQFSPLASAIQALILIKQAKYPEALKIAEDISAIEIMQPEAYVLAGEIFLRENRLTEATDAFQRALELNPRHARAHRWLGVLYYDTGAMRLATDELRAAAAEDTEDTNSLLLSGKIFQDYEKFNEALEDFQAALQRTEVQPAKTLIALRVAECLAQLRRLEEARQILEGLPPLPGVLATRAVVAESGGDFEQATQLAKQSLEIDPTNQTASLLLGRIYITDRQWDLALPLLEKLVQKHRHDHESHLLYGRALVGSGNREQGQQEIELATQLKDTFLKFADLHQDAIASPRDTAIRLELGQSAERLGKPELALSWYRAVLGLEPNNQAAQAAIERLSSSPVPSP